MRRLLGLIANPLDDECLLARARLARLRSAPRHALAAAARRRRREAEVATCGPWWSGLRARRAAGRREAESYLAKIPEDDATRLRDLCERLAELRARARTVALEELIERAVTAFDYDLATLMHEARREALRERSQADAARPRVRGRRGPRPSRLPRLPRGARRSRPRGRGRDRGGGSRRGPGDDRSRRQGARVPGGRGGRPGPRASARAAASRPCRSPTPTIPGDGEGGGPPAPRVGHSPGALRHARRSVSSATARCWTPRPRTRRPRPADSPTWPPPVRGACSSSAAATAPGGSHSRRRGRPQARHPDHRATDALAGDWRRRGHRDRPAAPRSRAPASRPSSRRVGSRFASTSPTPPRSRPSSPASSGVEEVAPPTLSPPPLVRRTVTAEPAAGHLSYTALATYGRCGYRFFAERMLGLPGQEGSPRRRWRRTQRAATASATPSTRCSSGALATAGASPRRPSVETCCAGSAWRRPARSWTARAAWSRHGSPRSCARSSAQAVRACARRCRSSFRWAAPWCAGQSIFTRTRRGFRWWSTTRRTRSGAEAVEELVDRYGVQREHLRTRCGPRDAARAHRLRLPRAGRRARRAGARRGRARRREAGARGADRGHRGGALRGHPRAARGALLGLSCPRPSLLSPEGADRPPAMTRVAVFAYGSLASLASAERTLGRPVEHAGRARLAGWRRRWSLARDNLRSEKTFARADDGTVPPHCLGLNIERRAGPGPNGRADRGHRGRARPPGGARDPLRPNRGDRGDRNRGPAGLRPRVHLHRQGPEPRRDAASRAR